MIAEATTKKCPMCAEDIPLEAKVCEYCGTRFDVVVTGYCADCHAVVEANPDGKCPTCGGEMVDRRVASRYADEIQATATSQPATAPLPFEQSVTAPQPITPTTAPPAAAYSRPGSFIDRNLRPGEVIVYRTRLHWTKLLHAVLAIGIAGAALFWCMAFALYERTTFFPPNDLTKLVFFYFPLFVVVMGIESAVAEVVGLVAGDVAVTNQRILGRVGGLIRRTINIPLAEIAAVKASRGLFFLFDYGAIAIIQASRKRSILPGLPRPHEVRMKIDGVLPSTRPPMQRVSLRKAGLGCLVVLLIALGAFAIIFVTTGGLEWLQREMKKSQPPVPVTFATLGRREEGDWITLKGYLDLPGSVHCDDDCGVRLTDSSGGDEAVWIFIDVASSGAPAPNQMDRLPPFYKTADFKVRVNDGSIVGDGDRVQITGAVVRCTSGALCIDDIAVVERLP